MRNMTDVVIRSTDKVMAKANKPLQPENNTRQVNARSITFADVMKALQK